MGRKGRRTARETKNSENKDLINIPNDLTMTAWIWKEPVICLEQGIVAVFSLLFSSFFGFFFFRARTLCESVL